MSAPKLDSLLSRLDLQKRGPDTYFGETPDDGRRRIFGGLVAAQTLVAATKTIDADKRPHSLHGHFLRAGRPTEPVRYEVTRLRDGRSFGTRRVDAVQSDGVIFSATVNFHVDEEGLSHNAPMPEAPAPETLPSNAERYEEYFERSKNPLFKFLLNVERPIEHRDPEPVDVLSPEPHQGLKRLWFRANGDMPDDPILKLAVLTYATDMGLLDNCIHHHGKTWLSDDMQIASLDHTVWYHAVPEVQDFHLFAMLSPWSGGARGMNFGRIYAQDGTLVAATAQESLMRVRKPREER